MKIRSEQRRLAAAVLGALVILIPTFAHARQVTFRWDYPASGAAGFKLYCGPLTGTEYTYVVDAGNTDVYKAAGLGKGNLRCVVTAYDSRRVESVPSEPIKLHISGSGRCSAGCDGDLNHDGSINVRDLVIMREAWGTSDGDADLNGDGSVNVLDLGVFRVLF